MSILPIFVEAENAEKQINTILSKDTNFSDNAKKIEKIIQNLDSWNNSIFNKKAGSLNKKIVELELNSKQSLGKNYNIQTEAAKKTLLRANSIIGENIITYIKSPIGKNKSVTDETLSRQIINHFDDYYFVTNETFLYKHILANNKWKKDVQKNTKTGTVTFDLKIENGKLQFHKGTAVEEIRNKNIKNKKDWLMTHNGPIDRGETDDQGQITLRPYKQVEATHEWHCRIKTSNDNKAKGPSLGGQHTWLEMQDPNGNVYSFGMAPRNVSAKRTLINRTSEIQMVYDHEYTSEEIYVHEIKNFNEAKFTAIKILVEEELNKDDKKRGAYNLMKRNCSIWALNILKDSGTIEEENYNNNIEKAKINIWRPFLPDFINVPVDKKIEEMSDIAKTALGIISMIPQIVFRPLAALVMIGLGGRVKRPDSQDEQAIKITDIFSTFCQLIHPLYLHQNADDICVGTSSNTKTLALLKEKLSEENYNQLINRSEKERNQRISKLENQIESLGKEFKELSRIETRDDFKKNNSRQNVIINEMKELQKQLKKVKECI